MTARKPKQPARKPIQKKYKKPSWAVRQIVRETGVVEDICEHGVGHPNAEWLAMRNARSERRIAGVHGCDGCCSKEAKKPSNVVEWGPVQLADDKIIASFKEALKREQAKGQPGGIVWTYRPPRKWGFWKRVWVSLFGA